MTGPSLEPLAAFAPAERALHAWVGPLVDDALLDEIAAADHGHGAEEHRWALSALRHGGLPDRLDWYPCEVLALTRWETPGDRRGHLKRLFACLVLVRAASLDADPVHSLAPLVDSAWELGPPARTAAVRFLAWCRLHLPGDWPDDPSSPMFLTLGVLLLSAGTTAPGPVAALFIDELDAALNDAELPWRRRPGSPLFARRDDLAGTRRRWLDLVTRCLVEDPASTDPRLVALGRALTGDSEVVLADLRTRFVDLP